MNRDSRTMKRHAVYGLMLIIMLFAMAANPAWISRAEAEGASVAASRQGGEEDGPWPPEGKKEAAMVFSFSDFSIEEALNGTYFINGGVDGCLVFTPFSLVSAEGVIEEVSEYHITFLSGDERLGEFFSSDFYTENRIGLCVDPAVTTEPGTAEFRVDLVSEHYWKSEIAKPVIVDARTVRAEMLCQKIVMPMGMTLELDGYFDGSLFMKVEPAYEYSYYFATITGDRYAENEFYSFGHDEFTPKKEGEYLMIVHMSIGVHGFWKEFPITIEVGE